MKTIWHSFGKCFGIGVTMATAFAMHPTPAAASIDPDRDQRATLTLYNAFLGREQYTQETIAPLVRDVMRVEDDAHIFVYNFGGGYMEVRLGATRQAADDFNPSEWDEVSVDEASGGTLLARTVDGQGEVLMYRDRGDASLVMKRSVDNYGTLRVLQGSTRDRFLYFYQLAEYYDLFGSNRIVIVANGNEIDRGAGADAPDSNRYATWGESNREIPLQIYVEDSSGNRVRRVRSFTIEAGGTLAETGLVEIQDAATGTRGTSLDVEAIDDQAEVVLILPRDDDLYRDSVLGTMRSGALDRSLMGIGIEVRAQLEP